MSHLYFTPQCRFSSHKTIKKINFFFCTSMIDFPEDKNELKKVYQNIRCKALMNRELAVIRFVLFVFSDKMYKFEGC